MRIAKLLSQDWLGAPLFERKGNRTRLLPHGAELARTLSMSLTKIEAACHRAREPDDRHVLVVAAIPSVAMYWLIPRPSRFRTAHPDIGLRVVHAMHGRVISFHDVHLAVVFAADPPEIPMLTASSFLTAKAFRSAARRFWTDAAKVRKTPQISCRWGCYMTVTHRVGGPGLNSRAMTPLRELLAPRLKISTFCGSRHFPDRASRSAR